MSYADTKCPCTGKKERDTMLCPASMPGATPTLTMSNTK